MTHHYQQVIYPYRIRGRDRTALAQLQKSGRFAGDLNQEKCRVMERDLWNLIDLEDCQQFWLDGWLAERMASLDFSVVVRLSKCLSDREGKLILFDVSVLLFNLLEGCGLNKYLDVRRAPFSMRQNNRSEEECCFLRAIREEPGEIAHRWVYSDWLDEQQDDRAELVRLLAHFTEEEINEHGRHIPSDLDVLTRTRILR